MTIDEAIKHCRQAAMDNREAGCEECAEEHKQLAEWLEELQMWREHYDCHRGRFVRDEKRFGDNELRCSVCGAILEGELATKWRTNYYCYHCGAKMQEEAWND